MISGTALLIAAIVSSIAAAGASVAGSAINANSQRETNQTNLELQNSVNAQQQYNMEHAHQIEMEDLKRAGLNPILTATGGNGAPLASLNAARMQAPQVDLSGVSAAINGLMSNMTMMTLLQEKNSILQQQQQVMSERNDVLERLYHRKGEFLESLGSNQRSYGAVNTASQLSRARKHIKETVSDKEWKKLLDEIEKIK